MQRARDRGMTRVARHRLRTIEPVGSLRLARRSASRRRERSPPRSRPPRRDAGQWQSSHRSSVRSWSYVISCCERSYGAHPTRKRNYITAIECRLQSATAIAREALLTLVSRHKAHVFRAVFNRPLFIIGTIALRRAQNTGRTQRVQHRNWKKFRQFYDQKCSMRITRADK